MSEPWYVTPGVYPEITPSQYLRAPIIGGSVTSSVLRTMTPPEYTPAHARWYLDQGRDPKGYYDVGSAYHTKTLGRGDDVVEIKYPDWKAPDARAERDCAYAAGKIPLLTKDVAIVESMYAATMDHPDCARLFEPGTFTPELVVVWRDEATGLMCRAMIDAVPNYGVHMTMVDLKTTKGHASPTSVSTTIARYGYHQQLAHYISGCLAIGLASTVTPVLVVCGKDAPHVPLCRPVDDEAIEVGTVCNAKAMDLYATCLATDRWPGYDDPDAERPPLSLPGWKRHQFRQAQEEGVYDVAPEEIF